MTKWWKPVRDERGQGVVLLAVAAVVIVIAVVLLVRTITLARSVNDKTETIAATGRGINTATDAILQLDRTNQFGTSILETSKPLPGGVGRIVQIAQAIDGLATSINGTALDINSTAKGINSTAAGILTTAQSINRGVEQINRNVDTTIDIARRIKDDTANILRQAGLAVKHGACIDQGLTGAADGHCR